MRDANLEFENKKRIQGRLSKLPLELQIYLITHLDSNIAGQNSYGNKSLVETNGIIIHCVNSIDNNQ